MAKWRKAWRDLLLKKGRMALVVIAIAIGVAAAGSVLGAYSIIDREVDRNYEQTDPPSAILNVEYVPPGLIDEIEARPDVAAAAARREIGVRLDTGEADWIDLRLVAIEDFAEVTVNRFFPEKGGWDPATGQILIERSSLTEVELEVGQEISAFVPAGQLVTLEITGMAHDPGRTPAWMVGQVVGYVNPDTLELFGFEPQLDEIRVVFADAGDRAANRQLADALAADLSASGVSVQRIEVPQPGEHPVENVMGTMLLILQTFGLLALTAGGAVVAILISAQLRFQAREIGLMKSIGAGAGEIASVYLGTVAVLGLAGLAIGLPLGILMARAYTTFVFGLLNFEITSYSVAGWVIPVQVLSGLAIPLLAVALPVMRSSRRPARQVLNEHGISAESSARRRFLWTNAATAFGLRNALRTRSRTVLTALALSIGGAAFMVALNSGVAWGRAVDTEFDSRAYTGGIQLAADHPIDAIEAALDGAPGVTAVESWMRVDAAIRLADGSSGTVYPVMVPPIPTQMVDYPMMEGRWLEPGDVNAVVVTTGFDDPAPSVGESVVMEIGTDESEWTVVGVVRQLGDDMAGFAYLNSGPDGVAPTMANAVYVSGGDGVTADAERALSNAGIPVAASATAASGRQALDDHLLIIVGLLLVMAVLIAIVGGLGLVETMSINVAERRREIGVMRALGASTRQILRSVVAEGSVVALASWVIAVLLSIPASVLIQSVTGTALFGIPLEPSFSAMGAALWLAIVLAVAATASALAAYDAADIPVQQALAYE